MGAMADMLRGPCGLAGDVLVDRVPFRVSEPERRAAPRSTARCLGPVAAQLRQGESGGQPPTAIPPRCPVGAGVAGEGDGVPGDLARIGLAEADPHQHPDDVAPGARRHLYMPCRMPSTVASGGNGCIG